MCVVCVKYVILITTKRCVAFSIVAVYFTYNMRVQPTTFTLYADGDFTCATEFNAWVHNAYTVCSTFSAVEFQAHAQAHNAATLHNNVDGAVAVMVYHTGSHPLYTADKNAYITCKIYSHRAWWNISSAPDATKLKCMGNSLLKILSD